MSTTTDESLNTAAQPTLQHTTPTPLATQTKNKPAPSQSGSTSIPGIHTSCPIRASQSATGRKNFMWSGANILNLITIIYQHLWQHKCLYC
ncbi:uncharacterized protein UHOD_12008 [Ustilago sp. UG-2017b]|nr:uncharacterized protein UHOD_12008 [Ustilago sp. UG-2017b]